MTTIIEITFGIIAVCALIVWVNKTIQKEELERVLDKLNAENDTPIFNQLQAERPTVYPTRGNKQAGK